ncbi:imidazole glycerol phosphate synthase subunit HisH [Methylocaldum sp.]|uniref:imidazole glycerol phosphate synthase subunit HisH n=1 Tax=Methylocaldum sp. TaxID=1969727 RepID=UPI002D417023|nr:imidazole glycerol phosphate synthase subunit HisH [Methylocaldum sp.]HYE36624.1 imidazole glycerol phosphate synthase subunit HisH [Methylocaldum sp.]
MSSVAVIDYGMGNLHSIAKALQHAHSETAVIVTDHPNKILDADRVVFPGVGAIRDCMNALADRGLATVLEQVAASKPLLGVCLGMQALLDESEENNGTACLGLIPGQVVRFADGMTDGAGQSLKIPHMGWNRVHQETDHPLWQGIESGSWFYFIHSYFARPVNSINVAATTDYPKPFASALVRENIFAVQFHPEKSQEAGLRLLANFLNWDPGR